MIYRAIGVMSGSSLDGLDIAFAEFHVNGGKWTYNLIAADCYSYTTQWKEKLKNAIHLTALEYQLLHSAYGHYIGEQVNKFIEKHHLHYQVQLISSHGHTTFHLPQQQMTGQIGDGASIAAETGINTISDLRAMDVAFGGQGAPIVPIGEKLLLSEYDFFLNLGGIANISFNENAFINKGYVAYDVCAANRVMNMLASESGKEYDEGGMIAAGGAVDDELLLKLNSLEYYQRPWPKSLANDFGTDIVYPVIKDYGINTKDALRTYVEHIADQVQLAIYNMQMDANSGYTSPGLSRLLVTGGGALNTFLIRRLTEKLKGVNTQLVVPDEKLINFKEALIMALIGVLRWREENNVMASVTGASRDSIGGAVWIGQEA
ncbi:MAG TPA: anhydro-N-acetylmuramic acid kinase [Chitinophagaceae bacterium]|nr:anhydro-N-acetylmuramic acid kinase [Chitinophagaceae bacterium]